MQLTLEKFKLSDASVIRQKFPATATVKELLEFVLTNELALHSTISINEISLVCVSIKLFYHSIH